MIKANNVPRLRFPGFTDAWEQKTLEDYLEISTKKMNIEISAKKMYYQYQVSMEW